MKFFDLLKEDNEPIIRDWKVIAIGRNEKGFYTISQYSAGGDSLSMFHLKLTIQYNDEFIDPMADFDGDVSYFDEDIKQEGINHSYEYVNYVSNTPTQNYIKDVRFKVVNGQVDFNNPKVNFI